MHGLGGFSALFRMAPLCYMWNDHGYMATRPRPNGFQLFSLVFNVSLRKLKQQDRVRTFHF